MFVKNIFPALAIITCIAVAQSCSKGGDSTPPPNPTPVVKPDTLSTGWTKQASPETGTCADIFFNSTMTGYLMGPVHIYRSTNGGNSWTEVSGLSGAWVNMFVTNDDKAFFTNNNQNIIRTVNGANITNINLNTKPEDVFFIDNNNGFIIAQSGLFNTVDGGNNWLKPTTTGLPFIVADYSSLYFINSSTGWVIQRGGGIYRSVGSFLNCRPVVLQAVQPGEALLQFMPLPHQIFI